jgi:crotonobetainyl-CoA:carnitine CoA-transferase CaiB-like acyl-CoA transferase
MPEAMIDSLQEEGSALPLRHITVLDLTRARAGPTAVRHLADMGAKVVHIEAPGVPSEDPVGKSRDGSDYQNLHRNKRMMCLDLKSPEGHKVFMKLVEHADVIIENMRPDVKVRLKVTYEDVKAVNPRIVYGSISGFGQTGPYANRAGVDQIAQGMGGLMSVTGNPGDGPMRVGIAINDTSAGNLLALGIVAALVDRSFSGKGRWVTTSLLETQIFMLDFQAARWLVEGEIAGQTGNGHPTGGVSGVFKTKDGFINLASNSVRAWPRFCDAIGKSEWKDKPEWKSGNDRSKHRDEIADMLKEVFMTQTSDYWVELLDKAGSPCGPIYSINETFADPHVKQLGMTVKMPHKERGEMELVASPINFDGAKKTIRIPTRESGADTNDVLHEVGYSDAEIEKFRAEKVV